MIDTILINSKILHKKFDGHNNIKDELLSLINSQPNETLTPGKYTDDVSRLDWSQSDNFDRPWVKFFMPYFSDNYNHFTKELGFKVFQLRDIWFQQYEQNGTHGWHTHSENYTGVYYLEMKDGPKTQVFDNKIIELPVSEGDIVIFPSFLVHKAPINKDTNRKTIISFNVNFDGLRNELLEKINV